MTGRRAKHGVDRSELSAADRSELSAADGGTIRAKQ